jgi:hypothetical protein
MDESPSRYWGYVRAALLAAPPGPMNVTVLYKPGKRLRSTTRASVLGDGLLERARSTTMALLGVTAAVGLGMVALALNQSWPLIANSPIPRFSGHEAVGKARIAAEAGLYEAGTRGAPATPKRGSDSARGPAPLRAGNAGEGTAEPPAAAPTELVVAPSAPAPGRGHLQEAPSQPTPPPPAEQAKPAAKPPASAATEPEPAPPPVTESPSPPATISEAPVEAESHVPPWSNGNGHAYGRSDAPKAHLHDD